MHTFIGWYGNSISQTYKINVENIVDTIIIIITIEEIMK